MGLGEWGEWERASSVTSGYFFVYGCLNLGFVLVRRLEIFGECR